MDTPREHNVTFPSRLQMTSESVVYHASRWGDSASVPNAGFLRNRIFTNDAAGAGYSPIWVERCRR